MRDDNEPTFEIACRRVRESDMAVLIDTGEDEIWIPLSQVRSMHFDSRGNGSLVMTEWIAKKKGLL